jgi:Ca-activated chloride channel family protein
VKQKIAAIFLFLLLSGLTALAQTPPPPPPLPIDDGEEIKIESRLVMIPVSVTDATGQPVTGLTAADFRVLEENRRQEIAEVGDAEKVPLEIALLFDISATTNPMFEFQQLTAAKFLQNIMRPDDRATIFTIGQKPVLVQARDQKHSADQTVYGLLRHDPRGRRISEQKHSGGPA